MIIKILSKSTAEKIAAGEVIENPASVVKELIENALDARATKIEVTIEGGGKELVSVTDNGCGINKQEIPIAFKRFATSKIDNLEDLFSLKSLGFRGEALPSIAAVSKIDLTSKPEAVLSGQRIELAGGEVVNEDSKFCILPEGVKHLESVLDENGDGIVSEEEIRNAARILEKARKKDREEEYGRFLFGGF